MRDVDGDRGVGAEDVRPLGERVEPPGCSNAAIGQAIPPVRIKEVCESLNVADNPNTQVNEEKLRCCIESICDDDFSDAINCLSGILQNELLPQG